MEVLKEFKKNTIIQPEKFVQVKQLFDSIDIENFQTLIVDSTKIEIMIQYTLECVYYRIAYFLRTCDEFTAETTLLMISHTLFLKSESIQTDSETDLEIRCSWLYSSSLGLIDKQVNQNQF